MVACQFLVEELQTVVLEWNQTRLFIFAAQNRLEICTATSSEVKNLEDDLNMDLQGEHFVKSLLELFRVSAQSEK